jgi:hypothetical protein
VDFARLKLIVLYSICIPFKQIPLSNSKTSVGCRSLIRWFFNHLYWMYYVTLNIFHFPRLILCCFVYAIFHPPLSKSGSVLHADSVLVVCFCWPLEKLLCLDTIDLFKSYQIKTLIWVKTPLPLSGVRRTMLFSATFPKEIQVSCFFFNFC